MKRFFKICVESYNLGHLHLFHRILRKTSLVTSTLNLQKCSITYTQSLHGKSKEKFQFQKFTARYFVEETLSAKAFLLRIKTLLFFLPTGCRFNIQLHDFYF